jgi:L-alanine-DL-glutamate epimerase-like enolase superfamily enzyme
MTDIPIAVSRFRLYAGTNEKSCLQLGERLFTRQDVRPYFELGCVDIIQPDIAHAGGISETKKIANMAEYVHEIIFCLFDLDISSIRTTH